MTSGAIAGFLDVAFNFNTQALLDDNLIGQLASLGWKMVMYGDDTWLRLFPNAFLRQDGVSSFYVKDTVEVDENVTRHLKEEFEAKDWDLLVLHYLGLDHVGHLGGRSSPLMPLKLKEMDDVIHSLHLSLVGSSSTSTNCETLLMLVSDHGMTHGGNHGGASFEETDALALFFGKQGFTESMRFETNEAFQVDLVPTLALLLGVPIPLNSVGVLLPELFNTLTPGEMLRALQINSWQIVRLLRVRAPQSTCLAVICTNLTSTSGSHYKDIKEIAEFCDLFSMAEILHRAWLHASCDKEEQTCSPPEWRQAAAGYLSFLRGASNWLAKGTTEKNQLFVYAGILSMFVSSIIFLGASFWIIREITGYSKKTLWGLQPEDCFALAGVFCHAFSLTSSSLVEEEQFTLHFLTITLFAIFLRKVCQQASCSSPTTSLQRWISVWTLASNEVKLCGTTKLLHQVIAIVIVLVTGRCLRGWYRGGVNWAHLPDVAKWLDQASPIVLLAVRLLSLGLTTLVCCMLVLGEARREIIRRLASGSLVIAAILIALYNILTRDNALKLSNQLPMLLAQCVYFVLGCTAFLTLFATPWFMRSNANTLEKIDDQRPYTTLDVNQPQMFLEKQHSSLNLIGKVLIFCWCLVQLLLQQPANAVPILLLLLQLISTIAFINLSKAVFSPWLKILALCWLGASGHFGLGNTNTLATVDVAGAYIGLSDHSILLSGVLAFMITYAAPLLFMFGALLMVPNVEIKHYQEEGKGKGHPWELQMVALPCTIPLVLSSVVLVVFTVVMLLMQGHLFIWSVFSPKYIYVCFMIMSTYIGVALHCFITCYSSWIISKD